MKIKLKQFNVTDFMSEHWFAWVLELRVGWMWNIKVVEKLREWKPNVCYNI